MQPFYSLGVVVSYIFTQSVSWENANCLPFLAFRVYLLHTRTSEYPSSPSSASEEIVSSTNISGGIKLQLYVRPLWSLLCILLSFTKSENLTLLTGQCGVLPETLPYGDNQQLRLPVAGAETAAKLINENLPSNEMFGPTWGVQNRN